MNVMITGTCCLKIFSKSNYRGLFELLIPGGNGGYNIAKIRSFIFVECENQNSTSTTSSTTILTSTTTSTSTTTRSTTLTEPQDVDTCKF